MEETLEELQKQIDEKKAEQEKQQEEKKETALTIHEMDYVQVVEDAKYVDKI